jgi:hypothetical protein
LSHQREPPGRESGNDAGWAAGGNSGTPPFWITVEQGEVTEMAQQYLP